jgi:hypothetical protein
LVYWDSPRPFAFDFLKLNGARFVDEYCFELRRQHQFHQLNEYKKAFRLRQLKLIGGSVGFLNVIELFDDYCDAPAPAFICAANSFSLFQLALISLLFSSSSLSRSTKEKLRMKLRNKRRVSLFVHAESTIIFYYFFFDCHSAFELSCSLIARLPASGLLFAEEINELKSINLNLFFYLLMK